MINFQNIAQATPLPIFKFRIGFLEVCGQRPSDPQNITFCCGPMCYRQEPQDWLNHRWDKDFLFSGDPWLKGDGTSLGLNFCVKVTTVMTHRRDTSVTGCCNSFRLHVPWWRHQMETFSALLVLCAGNSPVPGEFPAQRPVTRSFDVFFDLRPNKRLSKQWWGWWFETLSSPLWRHWNDALGSVLISIGILPERCHH